MADRSLVLFDFDGTIADSALGILRCMEHAFGELGVPMPSSTDNIIGPPLKIMMQRAGLPVDLAEDAVRIYRERYDDVGLFEANLYDGVVDMLETLGSAGIEMAVATSKQEPAARRMLDHFGLAHHFTYIGGATLDGTRGAKADVIEYVLGNLSTWSTGTTTMVGDREHDVHGAAAHALPCLGVTWGYGTAEELTDAGAFAVVEHPADATSLLIAR